MPLQNRVTPFGNIIAHESRGLFTGNRGILHGPATKTLHPTRRWTSKAWIICACDFKNRKRDVFGSNGADGGPGWTNLFFLDEATALAAGHRPCFYCQRERAAGFKKAFSRGQSTESLSAPKMDAILHIEWLDGRNKRMHPMLASSPDGVMAGNSEGAFLLLRGEFYQWAFDGYQRLKKRPADLALLTPPSTVAVLAHGYVPQIHPSVND